MKVKDVDYCQFQTWFQVFESKTLKASIIELPEEFVSYLNGDEFALPACGAQKYDSYGEGSDTEEWNNREEDLDAELEKPEFPALERKIKEVIAEYGHVYPKLNWSAPRDATWMIPNNEIKCSCAADIFLLLKSSDFIAHDLEKAYEKCEDLEKPVRPEKFYLVLKKWYSLNASMEFRCFVSNNRLIAVSQRDETMFFSHLKAALPETCKRIHTFFQEDISGNFFDCSSYTFDVYVGVNRVYIVDFNPWGDVTDSKLFFWDQLNSIDFLSEADTTYHKIEVDSEVIVAGIINSDDGVQASSLYYARLPRDAIDMASAEGVENFVDLCRQAKLCDGSDSDSDSEEDNMDIENPMR